MPQVLGAVAVGIAADSIWWVIGLVLGLRAIGWSGYTAAKAVETYVHWRVSESWDHPS